MFDRIHPCDPKQFPKVEAAFEGMFDLYERLEAYTHNTGMFNWGAGHANWMFRPRRWVVSRTWYGTHHGMPRVPWILYMRSGNPKYLRKAVRNVRHIVDIGFCRYSTPDREKLRYPHQKYKGALCDYKGLVHWHSGGRLPDYNCMTDFLLYAWYVTGDLRAWDMALEWGAAVKRCYAPGGKYPRICGNREGAGMMASLIALYQATWDPEYGKFVERHFKRMMDSRDLLPHGGFSQWHSYAPWLTRYVRLTNSEKAKKVLLRWADLWCTTLTAQKSWGAYMYGNYSHILGEAYHVSAGPKYLAVGLSNLQRAGRSLWRGRGRLYDGLTWLHVSTRQTGYFLQTAPEFMSACALHLKSGPLPEPRPHVTVGALWSRVTGRKATTHVIFIDNSSGGAFAVKAEGIRYSKEPPKAWVLSPSGKELVRAESDPKGPAYGAYAISLPVPDAGKGTYVLKLHGLTGGIYMAEPLKIEPAKRYVRCLNRTTSSATRSLAGLPVYVWVPEGTKQFTIHFPSGHAGMPGLVRVYDKAGRKVLDKSWVAGRTGGRESVLVKVPSEQDGGIWEIAPGPLHSGGFGVSEPIPPVFSIYRDKFYVPKNINALVSRFGKP